MLDHSCQATQFVVLAIANATIGHRFCRFVAEITAGSEEQAFVDQSLDVHQQGCSIFPIDDGTGLAIPQVPVKGDVLRYNLTALTLLLRQ